MDKLEQSSFKIMKNSVELCCVLHIRCLQGEFRAFKFKKASYGEIFVSISLAHVVYGMGQEVLI